VFNLGLGMVVAVAADQASEAVGLLTDSGIGVAVVGEVVAGERTVTML
jgi:phosphoribosylaminoimidazole (AIR) synthetase